MEREEIKLMKKIHMYLKKKKIWKTIILPRFIKGLEAEKFQNYIVLRVLSLNSNWIGGSGRNNHMEHG